MNPQSPGFSYLLAHPEGVRVVVEQPQWLALLPAVLLILFLARGETGVRRQALGWRGAALLLLALALAGLGLQSSLPSNRLSVMALVDRSDSIDEVGRKWEERYIGQVAGALAPEDELGVVTFARDAVIVRAPGSKGEIKLDSPPGGTNATDIGRALETALALFPSDSERRLLLLSDGNETRGDSSSRLPRARAAGVAIFPAVPPHAGGIDVAVEKLALPPMVAEGMVFPVRVVARNYTTPRSATLQLSVDGETIGKETIRLQSGLNAIEIPYRMSGPGSHNVRAEVTTPDDVMPGNNYREATLMVGGKTRVLLVGTRRQSTLATVLERKDIAVTAIAPADLPGQIEELLNYHSVVFEDVSAGSFAARKLDVLERYVRDFGGGLVVAAGERTFGDRGFKKTALERLLPVTLEPRRPPRPEREPLALFLVIDRSNSMGYHIHNRLERSESESKLEYAKRAALAVIGQLKDSDMAGLIVFDSLMFEVAPLRSLKENRALLERDIPRLAPGGGTDFYDALDSARKQLVAARVGLAHTILLTDGDTNRGAADHYPLIDNIAKAGISVTTVRIGDDTVNLQLLHDISSRTGGQFYHVENAETLPQLLLKDTSQALAQTPRHDLTFLPRIASANQMLRGIAPASLPELQGYAFAKPKPGADVLLQVVDRDKKDPLLAAWQYGLGRVVSFTASLGDDAETWVGWDGFGKLWSQLVHWVVREQALWDYGLEVQRVDGQVKLIVHAFSDLADSTLMARLLENPTKPVDVALVPEGPRTYVGKLPNVAGGRYPLVLTTRSGNHDVNQHTEFIAVPAQDAQPQEEFQSVDPNLPLLQALAAATGGAVDAPIRSLVERKPGTRHVVTPLDWLLIPAAMLCLLVDIGLRRLRGRAGKTPALSPAASA
ncbi:MAG: VWA domain-containing protein [Deltaproteobacteria bacterium]|nr:VWA domain-containing protein [Deltaproteobacteria bacterium]